MPKIKRFLAASLTQRAILYSLCFFVPLFIFLQLADEIWEGEPLPGDTAVIQGLHNLEAGWVDVFAVLMTHSASTIVVICLVAAVAYSLMQAGRRRDALFFMITTVSTVAINFVLKIFFARARPDGFERLVVEAGYSFPSGHSMIAAALAFSAIILCWRTRWRWWAVAAGIVYCVLVGLSRVYLGVHYPSDIVAAWCVSLLWVFVAYKILGSLSARKS